MLSFFRNFAPEPLVLSLDRPAVAPLRGSCDEEHVLRSVIADRCDEGRPGHDGERRRRQSRRGNVPNVPLERDGETINTRDGLIESIGAAKFYENGEGSGPC